MDAYDNFAACGADHRIRRRPEQLVRPPQPRSLLERRQARPDKLDAYWTLYECLLTTAKLIAPFVPFLAEALWQNLAVAGRSAARVRESVHLCDFPHRRRGGDRRALSARMNLVREIVSLGRAARMGAKLKVRQPLAKVEVILADRTHQAWLEEHAALIAEELNVKQVEFAEQADQYITYTVLPDLKRLGPRLGKQLPALQARRWPRPTPRALLAQLEADRQGDARRCPTGRSTLDAQDLQVRLQAKAGWAAAQGTSVRGRAVDRARRRAGRRRAGPRAGARDSNPPQGHRLRVHRPHRVGVVTDDRRAAPGRRRVCRLHPGAKRWPCELDARAASRRRADAKSKIGRRSRSKLYVKVVSSVSELHAIHRSRCDSPCSSPAAARR